MVRRREPVAGYRPGRQIVGSAPSPLAGGASDGTWHYLHRCSLLVPGCVSLVTAATAPTEAPPQVDPTGEGSREESAGRYERSPRDLLRLLAFGAASLITLVLTIWVEDSILGFEDDVVALFGFLTPSVERVLDGVLSWGGLVIGLATLVVPLVRRRYRLFGYVLLASTLSSLLTSAVLWLVDRGQPEELANEIAQRAGITNDVAGSVESFAQLSAAFLVLAPFVSRRWRRAGAVTLGILVLLRLLVSAYLPADILLALPLGAMTSAAVLLALGRPDLRPTVRAIRLALIESGLDVAEVHPAQVDARGSTPYFATLDDGSGLFVKVLGEEERAADLLFRVYRFLRLKDVGDDRPFSSLRRTVEHEALLALMARDVGIRTPRLRGVVSVGTDSMLLAYDAIDGRSLDALGDEEITDELMRDVWCLVHDLRVRRIAHRDLRLANVFIAEDRVPWLIDFGFSELAVADPILEADVAQLLASFAVVAGAERAVGAALPVLGRDVVAHALPRLQINALSGATKSALKAQKGLLEEVQAEVQSQCDVQEVTFEELERIKGKTLFTVVVLAAATYFLLPQFADLPAIFDQVEGADWWWFPVMLVVSSASYVGATASMAGSVPDRVATTPLLAAQLGAEFTGKLAPASVGGMALNIRVLQKQGVERPVAVAGVGFNTVAGVVAHLSLAAVFLVWAGQSAFDSVRLPDPHLFVLGGLVALAVAALSMALPVLRRAIVGRVVPIVARAFDGVHEVLRRPSKVGLALGGSALVTLSYVVTLYLAVVAFGGGVSLAAAGAVFLIGSAVASVAPTPGGLGAVEAALIGGLVAAGLDDSVAVPAVFLYRLCTFWLPVAPGWLCFTWLQRRDHI